jgi:predicted PurR-regulated permease PerM
MKYILTLFICFLISLTNAQNQDVVKYFDSIVSSSNNYQEYKVIKKANLEAFKQELISSNNSLNSQLKALENSITDSNKKISDLEKLNENLSKELLTFKNAKDEINLLGLKISKSNYQILVWSIIVVLLLILVFVFIKYRNVNIVYQEIKENLADSTKEFEEYKHRAIEKQQKLGRELLDAQKAAQSRNNKQQ